MIIGNWILKIYLRWDTESNTHNSNLMWSEEKARIQIEKLKTCELKKFKKVT